VVARYSFVLVVAIAMVGTPICLAQRHGGFGGGSHAGAGFGAGRNGSPFFNQHSFLNQGSFDRRRSDLGAYFWGDPFFWYGDNQMPQEPNPEPGPPILMMRPDTSPRDRLSPLLIELEGDRYVRHGGMAQSAQSGVSREPRTTPAPTADYSARSEALPESTDLTPTMLIFRDGHREQVPDYAIVGRVIYAHGDLDGEPGYGLKNIRVSELDIPATIRANRENGVSFTLPSGPDEVVTRP
jgi:hypothetical protein